MMASSTDSLHFYNRKYLILPPSRHLSHSTGAIGRDVDRLGDKVDAEQVEEHGRDEEWWMRGWQSLLDKHRVAIDVEKRKRVSVPACWRERIGLTHRRRRRARNRRRAAEQALEGQHPSPFLLLPLAPAPPDPGCSTSNESWVEVHARES